MDIDPFLESFIKWSRHQLKIEGVALVGSHARDAAIEESDVDLMILTSDRDQYLINHQWVSLFGDVERLQKETWGDVESIRATYTHGLEVEYGFAAPAWADVPVDPGTRRVVNDGFRILLDPLGRLKVLLVAATKERHVDNRSLNTKR